MFLTSFRMSDFFNERYPRFSVSRYSWKGGESLKAVLRYSLRGLKY